MEQTATLLVCCPDRKGLVAALAQLLYGHGANILDADQHTDPVAGQFFQRIKFDLSELHTDRTSLETAISEVAARFSMDWRITNGNRRSKTAIFVSKYDHCLYDLLLRQRGRELSTEIPIFISTPLHSAGNDAVTPVKKNSPDHSNYCNREIAQDSVVYRQDSTEEP